MKLYIPITEDVYVRDGEHESIPTDGYAVAEFDRSGKMNSVQRMTVTDDAPSLNIEELIAVDIPWFIGCLDPEDIAAGTYTFFPGRVFLGHIGPNVICHFFEFDTDNGVETNAA